MKTSAFDESNENWLNNYLEWIQDETDMEVCLDYVEELSPSIRRWAHDRQSYKFQLVEVLNA